MKGHQSCEMEMDRLTAERASLRAALSEARVEAERLRGLLQRVNAFFDDPGEQLGAWVTPELAKLQDDVEAALSPLPKPKETP